jgi:hypothetical protein
VPDPTAIRAAATARQAEMEVLLAQLVGIDSPSGIADQSIDKLSGRA